MLHQERAVIRVNGSELGVLNHILLALARTADKCTWRLFELEGVAHDRVLGCDVLQLEETVQQSPHGLSLKWDEVQKLSDGFADIWSFLLAGIANDRVPEGRSLDNLLQSSEYVVERFDSGDWSLFCRDPRQCADLADALQKLHTVRMESVNV